MGELELTKKEEKELVLKGLLSTPFITVIASVLTTFLIAAVFLKFAGPVPVSITQTTVDSASSFEISEEETIRAVPDQARVVLGVASLAPTIMNAQENVNVAISNLKTQLRQINIEDNSLKTTTYSIYPNYTQEGSNNIISGYNGTANLEILIKDFEKLNKVLDLASGTGINTVGPVALEVSDETKEKLEDQARSIAVAKAKKKAERIANASGLKLGRLINVREEVVDDLVVGSSGISESRQDSDTQITPGVTDITVRVTLSFETL